VDLRPSHLACDRKAHAAAPSRSGHRSARRFGLRGRAQRDLELVTSRTSSNQRCIRISCMTFSPATSCRFRPSTKPPFPTATAVRGEFPSKWSSTTRTWAEDVSPMTTLRTTARNAANHVPALLKDADDLRQCRERRKPQSSTKDRLRSLSRNGCRVSGNERLRAFPSGDRQEAVSSYANQTVATTSPAANPTALISSARLVALRTPISAGPVPPDSTTRIPGMIKANPARPRSAHQVVR
jgi:hypothetical protein